MNPKNFEALFALEQLMEKTGRWSDALRYVEEVLDMDDGNLSAGSAGAMVTAFQTSIPIIALDPLIL